MIKFFVERKSHFDYLADGLWQTIDRIKISCNFITSFDIFKCLPTPGPSDIRIGHFETIIWTIWIVWTIWYWVKHSCMHSKNSIIINWILLWIVKMAPVNQIQNRWKAKIQEISERNDKCFGSGWPTDVWTMSVRGGLKWKKTLASLGYQWPRERLL